MNLPFKKRNDQGPILILIAVMAFGFLAMGYGAGYTQAYSRCVTLEKELALCQDELFQYQVREDSRYWEERRIKP
jgi:hypothetical protein